MRLTRRTVCALLGALIFTLTLAMASGSAFATTFYSTNTSTSVGTSVGNALTLSGRAFPGGAPAAVVTNADVWSSAAGASVLANACGGPLLISSSGGLSAGVTAELIRLKCATVYVVGLPGGVGAQIDAALAGVVPRPQVVMLAGPDDYQTAVLVARQVKAIRGSVDRVMIVASDRPGGVMAGAAMAAGQGWPILLAPSAGPFPQVSADAIVELGATSGICIDTTASPSIDGFVVAETITGTSSSTDVEGRYSLNAKVAEYGATQAYSGFGEVALDHGYDFVGVQVLASYVASDHGVVLLTDWYNLSPASAAAMQAHGRDITVVDVVSLPWSMVRQVKSLNAARITAVSPNSGPVAGGSTVVISGSGLDTVDSVVMGKTTLPVSDWRIDSSTQLTILATPPVEGAGPAEVIVQNYWNRSPAATSDIYRFVDGSPALPGDRVVAEALKYVGVPYVWAGASPSGGFDCSGLAMYVYKQFGINLPHYSGAQAGYGYAVSRDQLLPGDLVFFSSPISHVGIYIGGGLMINAPRSGDLVTIENVFRSSYVAARRMIWPYARNQQNSWLVASGGKWLTSKTRLASGSSFGYLNSRGYMQVKFNGTSVYLIAKKGPNYGIARVTVDGVASTTVDLYSRKTKYQESVWGSGALSPGEHTVTIEWTGAKNRASSGYNISVDAFDVLGSMVYCARATRYQQTDGHLVYSGSWPTSYSGLTSGGSLRYTGSSGKVTVNFSGSYLAWIARKGRQYGWAWVSVDGARTALIDLYSAKTVNQQVVYTTGVLPDGPHALTIEWTGAKYRRATGTYVGVDAFDVIGTLTDAPVELPAASGWVQETDPRLGFVGSWGAIYEGSASSGAHTFVNGPAKVVVGFEGTSLAWIAKKASCYGIAKVTVDNRAPVEVDLYSPTDQWQQSVYATGELVSGPHTLTIEWTGTKNASASDCNIGVDAFEANGTVTQAPGFARYEENAPEIAYAGAWYPITPGPSLSGGQATYAYTEGSSATISFNGTYIAWLAPKCSQNGKAKVFLDGGAPVTVDLYSASTLWQQRVWNSGVLADGPHTVIIQWGWARNPSAIEDNLGIDAFEVMGTLTPATATVMHSESALVVIDPGHQAVADNSLEPVGPGSSTMKAKVSSGTASVNTGAPESALVLTVGMKLRDSLQAYGVGVSMTRETQDVNISNSARAQLANSAGADLLVRVHADGSSDHSVSGILMLYPATTVGWTDDIASESLRGATMASQELIRATGAKNRGLSARSDLAGFNWSDVPAFLAEIGLMTNPTEDALLATDAYQNKIVSGLTRAILGFLDAY